MKDFVLLSGTSNKPLAEKISTYVDVPLGKVKIQNFADGETFVEVGENVRGRSVYVIQSISNPVNNNLMELLILIDALKRASAKEIVVVAPYYGYARQERKVVPRTAITAKLVADLISTAGATRTVCMDLHSGAIQGFFNIPVDNLYASRVLKKVIIEGILPNVSLTSFEGLSVVSPDAGGVERVRAYAKKLEADVAIIDKRRTGPNQAKAMNVVGDVNGKLAIIVDDMIDTAGTLTEAAKALQDAGAREIYALATHGILSDPALERIENSAIKKVVVTDTIQQTRSSPKISVVSVAELFADAILRIHNHDSVSSLFS